MRVKKVINNNILCVVDEQGKKLNEGLLITLADHISFALQRKEQGIVLKIR